MFFLITAHKIASKTAQSFFHDFEVSFYFILLTSLSLQKLPSSQRDSGSTSPDNDRQESPTTTRTTSKSDEAFPENVQTAKERECYRLYQKMSSMGLNVSFDTVLRGMLTPTELRVIQKKKESELARQATLEREQEAKENDENKSAVLTPTSKVIMNGVTDQK